MANKNTRQFISLRRKAMNKVRRGTGEDGLSVVRVYNQGTVTRVLPTLRFVPHLPNRRRKVYPKREGANE
jgi:hypothetical protein